MKTSISEQISAVDRAIQLMKDEPEAQQKLIAAFRTLRWVEENQALLREFHQIDKSDWLREVRQAFPGAKITRIE